MAVRSSEPDEARVVCGVGEHESAAAVAFAATEADRLGAALVLVAVVPVPATGTPSAPIPEPRERREARERLIDAAARVLTSHPDLPVDRQVVEDDRVAQGLARAAAEPRARLLVVQQTRRGALHRIVMGSTVEGLAAATDVPLMSVPPRWVPRPESWRSVVPVVTVGVRDAADGRALLGAAVDEAGARGAQLQVLHVILEHARDDDEWVEESADDVHRLLDPLAEQARGLDPHLEVRVEVVRGAATDALLGAADVSESLVLGRRQADPVDGSPLGPVVRRVLLGAACPVLLPGEPVASVPDREVLVALGPGPYDAALAFGIAEAARRHVGLRLVQAPGDDVVSGAAAQVRATDASVPVTTRLAHHGSTADVVLDEAHRSSVIVLEHLDATSPGHDATAAVTNRVAAHAPVPVVAVPEDWRPAPADPGNGTAPVVVGIKDPQGNPGPLAAAWDEAASRGVPLRVVHADWWSGTLDPVADAQIRHRRAPRLRADLERAIALPHRRQPDVEVEVTVRAMPPAQSLTAASDHASLVVVGRRDSATTPHMPLGPVARAVLDHARCPVLLVDTPSA